MVEVFVKRDPSPTQTKGDWIVKVGRGQGGKNISRHRQKSYAVKRARKEANKRGEKNVGTTLLIQDAEGRAEKEAEYAGGHSGGGFFGFLG